MERRTSTELKDLVGRVAAWRGESGGRGSRIPEGLWKAAVEVAQVEGVWATAKALRFNYEGLKVRARQDGGGLAVERVRRSGGAKRAAVAVTNDLDRGASRAAETRARRTEVPSSGSAGAQFIALDMGHLGGAGRTVIDLVGRNGERMRLDVAGGVDVAGLVQTFWSGQS
jgi:hypothetical protein